MKPALFTAAVIVTLGTASSVLAACSDPAGPGVDWSACDLTRVNLEGVDLSSANLSRANLTYANMRGADLREANLTGADLRWAALEGAHLPYANLTDADLSGASLSGARLSRATWTDGRTCAIGSVSPRVSVSYSSLPAPCPANR
jgi:hypothetical protein